MANGIVSRTWRLARNAACVSIRELTVSWDYTVRVGVTVPAGGMTWSKFRGS